MTCVEDFRPYIEAALQMREEENRYPFAIFDKQAGAWAGSTSFCFVSNKDASQHIGYTWIGEDFQGTGLNKAMKSLMLEYAFEKLEFCRVEFRADSRNLKSRRAMEKIGAVYEGELRSPIVLPDGYRRSSVCYSILAEEWPVIKKQYF